MRPNRSLSATDRLAGDRYGHSGFTLLELLVVLVIIGLVVAGAIISLGATGRDGQLEQERDRLVALVAYARERGAMLTLEYGIRCAPHGYRFVYYDNRTMQWQPEDLDDTLRLRHLPSGLNLQLEIEGRQVVLDDQALRLPQGSSVIAGGAALPIGGPAATAPGSSSGATLGSSGQQTLGASADLNAHIEDNAPQIMLLSNGELNSFVLTIARTSAQRSVTLRSVVSDGTVSASDIVQVPP